MSQAQGRTTVTRAHSAHQARTWRLTFWSLESCIMVYISLCSIMQGSSMALQNPSGPSTHLWMESCPRASQAQVGVGAGFTCQCQELPAPPLAPTDPRLHSPAFSSVPGWGLSVLAPFTWQCAPKFPLCLSMAGESVLFSADDVPLSGRTRAYLSITH